MGFERTLSPVSPILFTANGGTEGQITLVTTLGLFVKQQVLLNATGLPQLNVQVKRVLSDTQILVGFPAFNINHRIDVSAYTVVLGANLSAVEQPKSVLPMEERIQASYIQEPSNSWRVTPVDSFGNSINSTNPLPVEFEGSISIGTVGIIGPAPSDNQLIVNADGSINVIVENVPSPNSTVISTYNEVVMIASGATVTIVSYTVPVGMQAVLQRCPVSGENVARYDLMINSITQDTLRTMFGGDLTQMFDFTSGNDSGLLLAAGDIVSIQVYNNRPTIASFEARIQVLQLPA
jgi:hypothetical protein